ncbi:MAG: SCP2 sterol-binding domain-containing protein [Endozoicomonadaceae bacterium]|nr:SCP2 sterol-binding domain-containing protein [Endozoicomonadaceae bacterium]
MTSITDVFDQMKEKFNSKAATGLDLVFQFDIEDAETYHLLIKDGSLDVVTGEHSDPNVTLIMNTDTLIGIMSGEIDGMQAFMGGKLRTEGDMMLATKLGELFPN